jgi:hypothetical protein
MTGVVKFIDSVRIDTLVLENALYRPLTVSVIYLLVI